MHYKFPHFKFDVPKAMYLFALAFAVFTFGNAIIGSVFPLFLSEFSDSVFFVGILGSISSILALFLSIYIGEAVDRYGTKLFLLIGLLATSAVYVGYYFSPVLALIIVFQILAGLSRELVYTPFFSLIREATSPKKLAQSFSLVQATSTLGLVVGPIIGGYFALNNLRLPFLISAAVVFMSFLILMRTKEPKFKPRAVDLSFECFRCAWRDFLSLGQEGKRMAFTILTLHTWYSAKWFIGPLLLVYLGYTSQDVGLWLSASLIPFLLLSMPFGSFADHNGKNSKTKMIMWGMMFSVIPLLMLGFSNGFWLYFFIIAIAIGNVFCDLLVEAKITEITPKNEFGEITGVIEAVKNLGWMLGPLLTTYFAQVMGYQYSMIPLVAMFLVAIYMLSKDVAPLPNQPL